MSDNYTFGYYLNNRAFIEHLKQFSNTKKIDHRHQTILSLVIHISENFKKIEVLEINNRMYKYVSDKLILSQNPLLKFKERRLKQYIQELKEYDFIKVHIENDNKRYIALNENFEKLLVNENWQLRPVNFLQRYKPHLFEFIRSEFKPQLKDFNSCIKKFNDSYDINNHNEKYNTETIFNKLNSYLEKCTRNEYSM